MLVDVRLPTVVGVTRFQAASPVFDVLSKKPSSTPGSGGYVTFRERSEILFPGLGMFVVLGNAPRSDGGALFRSRDERQSESAHKYLNFSAVSPALENAAEIAAKAVDFPIALVNILDDTNQYTLVGHGSGSSAGQVVPRSRSACRAVVDQGRPIVVQDALASNHCSDITHADLGHMDAECMVADLPFDRLGHPTDVLLSTLRQSGLRAYVSIPLFGRESIPVGTLCVLDASPRTLTPPKFRLLEQLAVMVEEHLDAQRDRARANNAGASVGVLTEAVDDKQFVPWYEPIVDLRTSDVYALEALARWSHPDHGVITPSGFIDRMEDTDLIVDLDLSILGQALSDFEKWTVEHPDLKLSVNISGHHLERPDCVARIAAVVEASGMTTSSVVLEITETARGAALDDEARVVGALRSRGFTVLLDDLGSGWSPVPRITHVSVDGFKLDRAVAASLHTDVGEAVANAMLHFAGELGHSVVLEGLENEARLERARELGFSHGQGHHISTAMTADAVPSFLDDWRKRV